MLKNRKFILAALMALLLLAPLGVWAEQMDAQQACMAAGGAFYKEPYAVCVVSPYGTQSVVLRDAPSDSYGAVAMLMVGQKVTAAGEYEAFYFVLLEDGTYGWLAADEIKEIKYMNGL